MNPNTASADAAAESVARARAQAKHVRMTPMKARRVVDLVRGRSTTDALSILKFAPQAASEPVAKVIASAVANAENNSGMNPDALVIEKAFVDEGPTLKRFQPRAQGRAFRIRKRTCHITIEVVEAAAETTTGADGSGNSGRSRRSGSTKGRTR